MTASSASGRIITWLFVLVPLCTGIFFFAKGATEHPLPWKSAGWNKADGIITGVTVTLRGTHTLGRETSGKKSWFDADISYQYEVNGKVYAGDDASFVLDAHRSERLDRAEAEARAAERFPVGAGVTVSYDPADPGTSTLQTGWTGGGMPDFATGASCVALTGYIGWSMWRRAKA
jgi:hypothetical protein